MALTLNRVKEVNETVRAVLSLPVGGDFKQFSLICATCNVMVQRTNISSGSLNAHFPAVKTTRPQL
jgi:hypothetical protein